MPFCSQCGCKTETTRSFILKKAPINLIVACMRFQMDWQTGQTNKVMTDCEVDRKLGVQVCIYMCVCNVKENEESFRMVYGLPMCECVCMCVLERKKEGMTFSLSLPPSFHPPFFISFNTHTHTHTHSLSHTHTHAHTGVWTRRRRRVRIICINRT